MWAADNTLIHEDPNSAPNIADITLPAGYNRKVGERVTVTFVQGRPSLLGCLPGNLKREEAFSILFTS